MIAPFTINTPEQYDTAKQELAKYFNQDACTTDAKAANDLMKAMDRYDIAQSKNKCTQEITG